MKKFLLYSSGLTALIVFTGILVIFDFFDLSGGKSQLIGSHSSANNQIAIHNEIVEQIHNIGNTSKRIHSIYYNIEKVEDVIFFTESTEGLSKQRQALESYLQESSAPQAIKTGFYEILAPSIKEFENRCFRASDFFRQQGFSDENRKVFENAISNAYREYTEKHNLYTEVLNSNRRY